MHTAIAEKSVVKTSQTLSAHKTLGTLGDVGSNDTRFTRVTRDANTVSIVVSDTPIPQPRVSVAMTLFGAAWSPPEVAPVQKHKHGKYTKKIDSEQTQAAKFRYVAVQNRLRAWDSDEVVWLHEILLDQTNREMRKAIEDNNHASIQEKLAWYEDMTWRPFSFPVCCAIVGANPSDVLQGIHQGLAVSALPDGGLASLCEPDATDEDLEICRTSSEGCSTVDTSEDCIQPGFEDLSEILDIIGAEKWMTAERHLGSCLHY